VCPYGSVHGGAEAGKSARVGGGALEGVGKMIMYGGYKVLLCR
jgi:hypothetical protein